MRENGHFLIGDKNCQARRLCHLSARNLVDSIDFVQDEILADK